MLSDAPATILFDLATLDKNDQRVLAAYFSVGVYTQYGTESVWMQTQAARGHLGMAPLVGPCNMAQPANKTRIGPGDCSIKLTPKDRNQPLGIAAHTALLNGLLVAALDATSGHSRKALIVQLQPGDSANLPTPSCRSSLKKHSLRRIPLYCRTRAFALSTPTNSRRRRWSAVFTLSMAILWQ